MEAVRVLLVSEQSDGRNRETVRMEGKGRIWENDGICSLAYVLAGEKPEDALRQKIELWPGRTIVKTLGNPESRMTFRVGERLQAEYHTPYGPLPMEVQTKKHQVRRGERLSDLELQMEYTLFLEGDYLADYRMKIVVEKER